MLKLVEFPKISIEMKKFEIYYKPKEIIPPPKKKKKILSLWNKNFLTETFVLQLLRKLGV